MPIYLSDKHNLAAVAAPAITDDRNDGYHEGSRWINVLTGIEYVCIDATVGSARWEVNTYAGTQSVAGLNAALGSAAETATRMSIKEEFTKRPLLTTDITPPSAPAAGTEYRLRIELNASRLALVYLNDSLVATTPALTTAVNLIPFGSLQALTAAAKSWDCRDKDFASMEQAA